MKSEHDAKTVVRTTVWVDTSSEPPTRPGERIEDVMKASCTAPRDAFDELATAHFRAATLSETAVLAPAGVLGSHARVEAGTRAHAARVKTGLRSMPPRPSLTRGATLTACAAAVCIAFLVGYRTAERSSGPAPHRPQALARGEAVSRARPSAPSAPASSPAERPAAPETSADVPAAVDALARGEYDRALALYSALARRHPNDAAFDAIVKRLRARCREQASEDVCEG